MFRLYVRLTAGVGLVCAILTGFWVILAHALPHEMLAFSATREGNHSNEIYVLDIRTGLISRQSEGSYPSWSPDGQKIAYITYEDHQASFYTTNPLGRDTQQIVSYSRFPKNRMWLGDRRKTALVVGAQKQNFFSAYGREFAHALENLRVDERYINWSPDGTKIVFVSSRTGYRNIYTFDLTTNTLIQVTKTRGSDTAPVWSPDGTKIAFLSTRNYHPEIYIINPDGTNEHRINHLPIGDYIAPMLEWSPDCEQITFYDASNRAFYMINANGGLPKPRLKLAGFTITHADWFKKG